MKILHTSDWHIGKKLMGRDRYDEFRAVLSEIGEICVSEKIELVLVAGDIFDTYTPSAEAEKIFYEGIKKISKNSAVLIISGNHDDYVRLTAAAEIVQDCNVYIIGNNLQAVKCNGNFAVRPVESQSGYVIFENAVGERLYVNVLPYPNEARFKEGKTDESFTVKMTRWIEFGERGKTENIPSVFLSHIFVAGGKVGDGEREIDLGGARLVSMQTLPDCGYCALGHLHRRQKLGKNAYYCGAIMQFSFDEAGAEKSVNVFDIDCDGVKNFKTVALRSSKNLIRLQANGASAGVELSKKYPENYVELTLNLTQPLTPNESSALHECENIISLKANVASEDEKDVHISNKDKCSSQLFTDYYKSEYGCAPSEELLGLFLSLTETEEE